jgi:hypothetical protein
MNFTNKKALSATGLGRARRAAYAGTTLTRLWLFGPFCENSTLPVTFANSV